MNETSEVQIEAGEISIPAQFSWPVQSTLSAENGQISAIVVLHDYFGLDDFTLDSAQRLNELGYATIAPDLFARSGGPESFDSEAALASFTDSLYDTQLTADVLASVSWLKDQDDIDSNRIGVLGWGWGGAYALLAASQHRRIRAAVNVAGHLTYATFTEQHPGSPLNHIANIEGALLAAFPATDPRLPPNEIERLIDQMREHEIRGEVKVYDATPRFWREDSHATQLLWHRIKIFLEKAFADPIDEDDDIEMDIENEESRLHATV